MDITTTYSVKIKHFNAIFRDTIRKYQNAVNYCIQVCLENWDLISSLQSVNHKSNAVEHMIHATAKNPNVKYDFDCNFYKFPTYLRRAAIREAIGSVSSYKSLLANWNENHIGCRPSPPKAGNTHPILYRKEMFVRTGNYTARIKVFIRNTWDWLDVELKKTDVDYILHHCQNYKECVPRLQKRGKEWFLDFSFQEKVSLNNTNVFQQTVLAVDLGVNNACTCSVMRPDGTVLAREFLHLTREEDCLRHALNRIKKAQQNRAKRTPRLWALPKNINTDIARKTAMFIVDVAARNGVHVIVFEHLGLTRKKRGTKKLRLHLWKARSVQNMVSIKAHRLGIRISHVCAWGTSAFAFDGSGRVKRNVNHNYSLCVFQTGKLYNCDLNATYNIGARYFIREILREMSVTTRLTIQAKVPECVKRATCTLSSLINLNAVLTSHCF